MRKRRAEGGSRLLSCPKGNDEENRAAGSERLAQTKMFGRGSGHGPLWDAVCAACIALSLAIDMNLRSWNNYYNWYESIPDTLTVAR